MDRSLIRPSVSSVCPSTSIHLVEIFIVRRPNPSGRPIPYSYRPTVEKICLPERNTIAQVSYHTKTIIATKRGRQNHLRIEKLNHV